MDWLVASCLVSWWVGGLVGWWVGGLVGWWVGGLGFRIARFSDDQKLRQHILKAGATAAAKQAGPSRLSR